MSKLIEIISGKCGRKLAETLPGADAFCPTCRRWASERKTNKVTPRKAATMRTPLAGY